MLEEQLQSPSRTVMNSAESLKNGSQYLQCAFCFLIVCLNPIE